MQSAAENYFAEQKHPSALEIGGLVLIILIGAGLRFYRLSAQSVWFDESLSIAHAEAPPGEFLQTIAHGEGHPPLYFLLLRAMTYFGSDEVMMRLLSVAAGIAAIPLLFLFSRWLLGSATALTAAGLLALSPFAVYFSQEARPYALLAALSLASCYALLLAVDKPSRSKWIIYTALTLAAVYTHYYAFILIIAQGAVVLASTRLRGRALTNWLVAQAAVLVAYVPWLPYMSTQFGWHARQGGLSWIPDVGFLLIPYTFFQFSLGYSALEVKEIAGLWPHAGLLAVAFVAFAIPFAAAAVVLRKNFVALRWVIILPLVAMAVAYILNLRLHSYQPAYLAGVMPIYLLAVAYGLQWLLRRPVFWFIPGLIALLLGLSLWNFYFNPKFAKEDWRSVARYLERQAEPTDVIAFHKSYTQMPFNYYYDGDSARVSLPDAPLQADDPGLPAVGSSLARYPRVWLVVSHNFDTGPYYENLLDRWFARESCTVFETCRPIKVCRFDTGEPSDGKIALSSHEN